MMDAVTYIDSHTALSPIIAAPTLLPTSGMTGKVQSSDTAIHQRVISALVTGPVGLSRVSGSASKRRFKKLAAKWKADTIVMSSIEDMAMNQHYQQIIGMGPAAVPIILERLKAAPDFWFWALRAITGVDPVAQSDRGNVQKMTEAWLRWGRARGYSV